MGVMFLIWLNQNNQGPVQLSTSQRPAKALKSDSSEADFHFQFTGCVPHVSYDAPHTGHMSLPDKLDQIIPCWCTGHTILPTGVK